MVLLFGGTLCVKVGCRSTASSYLPRCYHLILLFEVDTEYNVIMQKGRIGSGSILWTLKQCYFHF